jgi:flagellar biosynthesis protein FlhF
MKIQRFDGQDVQEALRLARLALGPEAVILQTRRVPASGLMKLIGRPRVEVLAAVDNIEPGRGRAPSPSRPDTGRAAASQAPLLPPALRRARRTGGASASGEPFDDDRAGNHRAPDRALEGGGWATEGTPHRPVEPRSSGGSPHGGWQDELAAVRQEMAELRGWLAAQASHPPGPEPVVYRQGLPDRLAHQLLSGIVTRTIEIREGICTAVALVGPTGVGKTTTLAKLAAVATRVERRRVAFITTDTYRIGAVEQLETYARLLDVPLTVAYSPEEMRAARARYADYDLVLVDTVGRSPGNRSYLEELAALLAPMDLDEVHLALDARGSCATLRDVLRGFSLLRPTQLLLSKLDETPRLEDSLTVAVEGGLPVSYITTGQCVPEDLAPADKEHLAEWLLGRP